ncbi:MAG: cobalamin-dependent protein [Candidatus Woesearchaeota archaeon]
MKNNNKILLINPFWSFTKIFPPVNLAQLAGFVRQNGFDVSILDLNYELSMLKILDINFFLDESLKLIKKYNPKIVGLICDTVHLPFCVKFIPLLKKTFSNIKIIIGGNHASSDPKKMFELFPIDFVVIGEGELTFVELLDSLIFKKDFSLIKGISYKNEFNKIVINLKRELINDLSILPMPAYDLILNLNYYLKFKDVELGISGSRGCFHSCLFCASNVFWGHQRFRKVDHIINEIKFLIKNYNIKKISFDDLCLTNNKKWFLELLEKITPLNIKIRGFARIDHLDEDLIIKIKKAGFYRLYHGIESGSSRLRNLLHKNIKNDLSNGKIIKLINFELENNILPVCSFMSAIPTETVDDFHQTFNLLKQLKNIGAQVQFWIMTPYPGIYANEKFKKDIIWFDRWKELKQSDIFFEEQRILFSDALDKLKNVNPDNFMFKPNIPLKKFLKLYNFVVNELDLKRCENYLFIKPPIEEIIPPFKNVKDYYSNPFGFFSYGSQPIGFLKIASYFKHLGNNVKFIDCASESSKNNKNSIFNIKKIGYKKTGDGKRQYPLYHCGLDYSDFTNLLIDQKKPDKIFITTSMTYHFRPVHKIIEICKQFFPNSLVIVGGIYASISPEHLLKTKADFIFCGQFKESEDYNSDLNLLDYKPHYAVVKSTRGCPNKCSYCAVHMLEGNEMFFRNYKDTFNEIKSKYDEGIKNFIFWESNLLVNCKNHFEKILDLIIKNNLNIDLSAPEGLQPNLINYSLAEKMKKAGFSKIHLPLETSTKKIEQQFNRPSNLYFFKKAIKIFKKAGFSGKNIICFILFGFANDKLETVIDSFIKTWEEGCVPKIMPFTPIPNTIEYKKSYELIKDKDYDDLHPFLFPFSKDSFSAKDCEDICNLHRVKNPINYFKNNYFSSKVNKLFILKIKSSKKIWDNYYLNNFNTLNWIKDIPDTIIVEFIKNFNKYFNINDFNKFNVLDIGCGVGKNSLFLEKKGFNVYGIDISKIAINNLNKNIKSRNNFIVGNFLNVNYKKNKFDIIIDVGCFHMVDKKYFQKYINQVHDILKPNGIFIIRVFSEYANYSTRFFQNSNLDTLKSPFLNYFTKKYIFNLFKNKFILKNFKENFWSINLEKNNLSPGIYELIFKKI